MNQYILPSTSLSKGSQVNYMRGFVLVEVGPRRISVPAHAQIHCKNQISDTVQSRVPQIALQTLSKDPLFTWKSAILRSFGLGFDNVLDVKANGAAEIRPNIQTIQICRYLKLRL